MNKIKGSLFAASLLSIAVIGTMPVTQTGCKTVNGTNTFDVTVAADAIKNYLGPVVVFEENSDPSTIPDFQTASAALGILISDNSTDVATLRTTLEKLGKTPIVKLGIDEAVGVYSQYVGAAVANGVSQSDVARQLLQAFKDALDQGIKAQVKRMKAHRPALRHS